MGSHSECYLSLRTIEKPYKTARKITKPVVLKTMSTSMSKTFIGGAVCREFESEVPAAEEMLDHVVCSRQQFSFQMCLESGDGSATIAGNSGYFRIFTKFSMTSKQQVFVLVRVTTNAPPFVQASLVRITHTGPSTGTHVNVNADLHADQLIRKYLIAHLAGD